MAYNYGLLPVNYGLLWGIVACCFRRLGVPGMPKSDASGTERHPIGRDRCFSNRMLQEPNATKAAGLSQFAAIHNNPSTTTRKRAKTHESATHLPACVQTSFDIYLRYKYMILSLYQEYGSILSVIIEPDTE